MYKLWHVLFGWDYIHWSNSADQGVARIFTSANGDVCFWKYRSVRALAVIKNPKEVTWLTCPSFKYFP